ncbi:MAG TPA: DUF1800 family protein, partial [Hyphomicrobium sp.]|nr:DUF1800 family protein [Hyphomicrobium sp.]
MAISAGKASACVLVAALGCAAAGWRLTGTEAGANLSQATSLFAVGVGEDSQASAVRLAKQASFGPSQTLVAHIADVGVDSWLDEQFAAKTSTYVDLANLTVPGDYCGGLGEPEVVFCNRDYLSAGPVAMRFYANAVTGQDQLRQRVAFALSQIVVASANGINTTAGTATFQQIFLDNAFGNYRDI